MLYISIYKNVEHVRVVLSAVARLREATRTCSIGLLRILGFSILDKVPLELFFILELYRSFFAALPQSNFQNESIVVGTKSRIKK